MFKELKSKSIIILCMSVLSNNCIASATRGNIESACMRQVLYVEYYNNNFVNGYSIESGSANLIQLSSNFVNANIDPEDLEIWHGHLYAVNWAANLVTEFFIESTTNIPVKIGKVNTDINPWSLAISPSGRFAYVGNTSSATISCFSIGIDGILQPIGVVYNKDSPSGIGFNTQMPDFVYVTNYYNNSGYVYRIQESGLLTSIGRFSTQGAPRGIWFDRANHAYVLNETSNSISIYKANSDGSLSYISSIATEVNPRSIVITSDGKFAYVAGTSSGYIAAYGISSNGMLSPIYKIYSDSGVRNLVIDNFGRLYASNMYGFSITVFEIDKNTGQLILIKKVPTIYAPYIMALGCAQNQVGG